MTTNTRFLLTFILGGISAYAVLNYQSIVPFLGSKLSRPQDLIPGNSSRAKLSDSDMAKSDNQYAGDEGGGPPPVPYGSEGGLTVTSKCPNNYVSIGNGYCQKVLCYATSRMENYRCSDFGCQYDMVSTGAVADPRLVKLGYNCGGSAPMLSNIIVPES